jgi:hypothetical protein
MTHVNNAPAGMGGDWDELLAEARQKLAAQREQAKAGNAALGDEMTPAEEAHFAGRWRGEGTMQTKHGPRDVFLVWDRDGMPGFLYRHAGLVLEVDAERPEVGDEVIVLRGRTECYERDGESRRKYPYVLRRRPSSDVLPGVVEAAGTGGPLADHEDLPF